MLRLLPSNFYSVATHLVSTFECDAYGKLFELVGYTCLLLLQQ